MGSGGGCALAAWASTVWSLCEGRLGDNKSTYWRHSFRMCLLKMWSYFQCKLHRERYAHRGSLVKNVFFHCEESLICVANKFTHFIDKKLKMTLSKLRTSATSETFWCKFWQSLRGLDAEPQHPMLPPSLLRLICSFSVTVSLSHTQHAF